jgi:phosphatidate cytidylyltransferase
MLRQRIVTAAVLLAALLPVIFAKASWPFAAVTLLLVGAAGWEWGRLNGLNQALAVSAGTGLVLMGALAWWMGWVTQAPQAIWPVGAVLWVVVGACMLSRGVAGWRKLPALGRLIGGLLALCLAWLALVGAKVLGVNFLLSVLCCVWMADSAAYFGGHHWGRKKLAPTLSPGKSWEGVFSGVLGVFLLAIFWLWLDQQITMDSPSIFTAVYSHLHTLGLLTLVLMLCAMSVVGDLLESLVKRAAGVKDSSQLLPGHGGVLDRIDALIPVFPVALALLTL